MNFEKRKTGITAVPELPWGSHFCLFSRSTEDLLDILLPYFGAGLESNELCVWVVSGGEDAKCAALSRFAEQAAGQLEVIPASRLAGLEEQSGCSVESLLDRAVARGFEGLRLAFDCSPEQEKDAAAMVRRTDAVRNNNILALFAYARERYDAAGLMEIVKNHRLALVRNSGTWEVIESSEARVMKADLLRSEEKLKFLFSSMSEGFGYHRVVLDAAGQPRDYVFLEVNDAFERLTGLTAKNIIGKRVTDVILGIEKDPTDWIGKYGKVALTGKPVIFESLSAPLGKWYLVSAFSPQKGYFAATFTDITERKKAEEELHKAHDAMESANVQLRDSRRAALNMMEDAVIARRQVEETNRDLQHEIAERKRAELETQRLLKVVQEEKDRLSALINSISDEIWFADTRKQFTLANPSALREFGIRAGGTDVQKFAASLEVFRPDGSPRPVEEAPPLRALQGEVITNQEEIIRTPATGELRYRQVSSAPVRDAGGSIIGSVSVVHDITERKKAEADVLKLSEDMAARNLELESTNKEMEAFIYSVSHDLRAPLRSVAEFARIVREDYADRLDEQGNNYLARISRGAAKMSRLIEDLLYLSRITRQDITRSDMDLSKVAATILAELRETRRDRNVACDIQEGLSVHADPRLMEVALANLLGNAWKFTAKREHACIAFGSMSQDGNTVYFVRDNGAGFDPAYADKMFWPFQRLHSAEEFDGTGIGLTIVERVIRRHGGKVWADGAPGKGATVYFTLG